MGVFVRHTACESCGSSDGKAVYDDESWHCFVCGSTSPSQDVIEESKSKRRTKKKDSLMTEKTDKKVKALITDDEALDIVENTGISGKGYRNIRDEVYAKFGVRHEYDEATGEVTKQYYPVTKGLARAGYKIRTEPKNFFSIGNTGLDCDLFMQRNFQAGGKWLILTEGEVDALSAYQMLKDYYDSKGGQFEVAAVSGTVGVKSIRQIAAQYKFLDSFSNIVVSYDNDAAGKDAIEDLVKALPKGKVKIMKMSYKDANQYLENDESNLFIKHFFSAESFVPTGVVPSNQISAEMRSELSVPKVPLPPFMHKLQDMMAGGIPLGRIVNLGSASGTGKSTITDEILYYMIFNSPHLLGVVTLESTCGQYGIKLLSRHLSKKIELLDNEDAVDFLNSEDVLEKEFELFNHENGTPRFYLVDDRDGSVDNIQDAIENLIIACGCKVIILDPIHDVISSLPLEDQDKFIGWQKGMIKSHGVTFLNVCHTRKTQSGDKAGSTGANLHEEDIMGSSALYKSAACNLMFTRNKEAEDDMERNTTIMKATKIRWTGKTGVAGMYYYDNETHTLWDLEDYNQNHAPSQAPI